MVLFKLLFFKRLIIENSKFFFVIFEIGVKLGNEFVVELIMDIECFELGIGRVKLSCGVIYLVGYLVLC